MKEVVKAMSTDSIAGIDSSVSLNVRFFFLWRFQVLLFPQYLPVDSWLYVGGRAVLIGQHLGDSRYLIFRGYHQGNHTRSIPVYHQNNRRWSREWTMSGRLPFDTAQLQQEFILLTLVPFVDFLLIFWFSTSRPSQSNMVVEEDAGMTSRGKEDG